jgi:hypothetical protein
MQLEEICAKIYLKMIQSLDLHYKLDLPYKIMLTANNRFLWTADQFRQ